MKFAPELENENQRLAKLQSYRILDTGPEVTFDEITKLAATMCGTKISLVSLIDANRQWFKSRFGLEASETPRDVSFCGHAINQEDIFIVEDADADPRFQDNPLVTGAPFVKFYAGVPLMAADGLKIGTLCVIDSVKKSLSENQKILLKSLANHIVNLLEIRLKDQELIESKRQLQMTNQYLLRALEGANLGAWDWDLVTNQVSFDAGWANMLGYTTSEIQMNYDNWESRVHPDDLIRCKQAINNYLNGLSTGYEIIHRMKHKAGHWVHILARGKFTDWDQQGKPIRFSGTHLDMTEHKQLEVQLVEAQAISKIGSWSYNLLTHHQTWSQEHYKIFEIEEPQPQEKLHQLYRERIHPDDLKVLDEILEKAVMKGEDFVFDHRVYLDGGKRIKYVQGRGKVEKNKDGIPVIVSGTCRDRTEEIEKEEKYRALLESMNEGLVVQDAKGNIVEYNTAALNILGVSADQLMGRTSMDSAWKAVRPDGTDFPGDEHPSMIALRTGRAVNNVMMGLKGVQEDTRWILISAVPTEKQSGRHVLATFSDITSLVKANEENKFVIETIGMGLWKVDLQSLQGSLDKTTCEMLGLPMKEFTGNLHFLEKLLNDGIKTKIRRAYQDSFEGKAEFSTTLEIDPRNGKKKFIGVRAKLIRSEAGDPKLIYGINWDRTKEVELELDLELERARALHNAKLASIGQLAAGVGHEINNPLAIISGQVSVLESHFKDINLLDTEITSRVRKIDSAVDRISNIVKGLRTFARPDDNTIHSFEIYEMVHETISLLKEIYQKEGVRIHLDGDRRPAFVNGNRGRLQQVLINLLSNAKDATQGIEAKEIVVHVTFDQKICSIAVIDRGHGVPDAIKAKIFEPFFTTKEINKGSGIGLSLASSIVKDHNGRLEMKSKEGVGSTFTILIPVEYVQNFNVENTSVKDLNSSVRDSLRVLVVDDEVEILHVLKVLLTNLGCEIRVATNVKQAVEIVKAQPFDLILSDIKMPGIDGFGFLKILKGSDLIFMPQFVFMSGGVDLSPELQDIISRDSQGIVLKPFKLEQITTKIKELFPKKFQYA